MTGQRYVVTQASSAKGTRYEVSSGTRDPGIGRRPRTMHIATASPSGTPAMKALCGVNAHPWPDVQAKPEDATCRRCVARYRRITVPSAAMGG